MSSTRRVQLCVALALLAGCSLYLYAALGFSFGTWRSPRAGFMPTIVGFLGVALAVGNLIRVLRSVTLDGVDLGLAPVRALAFLAILAAYAAMLSRLGFLPSTFAATLALLLVGQTRAGSKLMALVIASAFSIGAWLLFGRILNLPLP
nr:tripartite tricarboxylate transporter TctB family protein [Chelatococcus sp. YT9]